MSSDQPVEDELLMNHYGLAIEQIKLERSIKYLSILTQSFESSCRSEFLEKELADQEKQLLSLRNIRSSNKNFPS